MVRTSVDSTVLYYSAPRDNLSGLRDCVWRVNCALRTAGGAHTHQVTSTNKNHTRCARLYLKNNSRAQYRRFNTRLSHIGLDRLSRPETERF